MTVSAANKIAASNGSSFPAHLPEDIPPGTHDRDLPRERMHALGTEALSDAELVALLLRTGGGGRDAVSVARVVLDQAHGLLGLARFIKSEGDDRVRSRRQDLRASPARRRARWRLRYL